MEQKQTNIFPKTQFLNHAAPTNSAQQNENLMVPPLSYT